MYNCKADNSKADRSEARELRFPSVELQASYRTHTNIGMKVNDESASIISLVTFAIQTPSTNNETFLGIEKQNCGE